MIIRNYREKDLNALCRIDNVCFPKGIAYTRSELKFYISRREALTLIAEEPIEGAIVGFIIAFQDKDRPGHIITIDVLPDYRRRGTGSLLLEAVEQELFRKGILRVRLETSVENAPALGFYEKHRYRILERLPGYYKGKVDAYLLEKSLP